MVPRIGTDLKAALGAAAFGLDLTGSGEDAWFLGDTKEYDLVVLDLGLPGFDGVVVLKRWRTNGRTMPLLVPTAGGTWQARGTWQESVEDIEAGADDYLPKPFRMEELIARVRALVRGAGGHAAVVQEAGEPSLDTNRIGRQPAQRARAGDGIGIPDFGLFYATSRPSGATDRADSSGRRNGWFIFHVGISSSASAGVFQPRVLRGRLFNV